MTVQGSRRISNIPINRQLQHCVLLLLLLLPDPFRGMGGMTEDHGATEAGRFPKAWIRGRRETESRQRASGPKSP